MRRFLPHLMLLAFCALASFHAHAGDLSPRAEINFRAGTERSILMTEFWAPLAQQNDRVLYGDLRLMGDGDDNREGNLGFGYRQISKKTNSVLGANAWIDRRRTENGNTFHQMTLGVESLGEKIDLRANGYIQLNNSKSKVTPNIGSATPYLVGSGIFYDTNGFIVEEPQHGFDAEIGYRLPVFEKHVDSLRAYAGGYHFFGDTTKNTTGFRIRTEAQINSIFSIGARFQHDAPRGSQGFLEATLRFPFSAKKSFQKEGLRSRLDESPERDIDIVTGAKVDNGLMKPVLNASGTTQRILYVDNTNTNAGDGSKENPFNTLKAAEAAMQVNDILYINRGDGTTTGMDQGLNIYKSNITLVGSGSQLRYGGYTLLNAGLAPVITNTEVTTGSLTGNGILVTAANISISGVTVSGASRGGINITYDGVTSDYILLNNVTLENNAYIGSTVKMTNNSVVSLVSIIGSSFSTNAVATNAGGLYVGSESGSTIKEALVENNIATGNYGHGLAISAQGGTINSGTMRNNNTSNNTQNGLTAQATVSGIVGTYTISNNTSNNNVLSGIQAAASTQGSVNYILLQDNTTSNNSNNGTRVISNNSGSLINRVDVTGLTTIGNTQSGAIIELGSGGVIGLANVNNVTTRNNLQQGVYITNSSGNLGSVSLSNIITTGNSQRGINISTGTSTSVITNITIDTVTTSNNVDGLLLNSAGGSISKATITNVTATNNRYGIYLVAQSLATLTNVNLSNITSTSNTSHGLFITQTSSGAGLTRISVSSSNFTGNTGSGAFLSNANAAAAFTVDLGGGAFGSIGQNRIFGNTANDLNLDRAVITAGSNWWNNGGAAPTRVTTTNGGSATYTTPLATDPRP